MSFAMLRKSAPAAVARRSTRSTTVFRPLCVAKPQIRNNAQASTQKTSEDLNLWLMGVFAAPFFYDVLPAAAADATAAAPPHDILKGTAAALVHPAMMFFLLGASLYAAYLGYQWRRTRELGEEIRALKASAPAATAEGPAPPNPVISQKEQERKTLLAGGFKDKHHMWGSLLLASGVGMAIEGAANTFTRTGKLFPGPHLYAGAFICALWALAASLTPAMQKGDNNARNAHIVLNCIQIGLFLWQVPTGLEIVEKVFQFTTWP